MTAPAPDHAQNARYGRRWCAHAWAATKRRFRDHLAASLGQLITSAAGFVVLSYLAIAPDSLVPAVDELRSLVFAATGGVVLYPVLILVWELIRAPAAMEREATRHAEARRKEDQRALQEERQRSQELQGRIDAGRLRLELTNESPSLHAADTSNGAMAAFMNDEERSLMGPFNEAQGKLRMVRSLLNSPTFGSGFNDERRSADGFTREVRDYLRGLSERWTATMRRAAVNHQIAELRLAARNPGEVPYQGVEVQLFLPSTFGAGWDENGEWEPDLPERPKPWGEDTTATVLAFDPSFANSFVQHDADPGTIEEVEDHLVITWAPFDLRPGRRLTLPSVWLAAPGEYAGKQLRIRWTAASTATGSVGRIEDQVVLTFAAQPVCPHELLLPLSSGA